MKLETERLYIVDLPLLSIQRRLQQDDFWAEVETPSGIVEVHFPPEWPGDILPLFPDWIAKFDLNAVQRGRPTGS